jgi:hypothetical protein
MIDKLVLLSTFVQCSTVTPVTLQTPFPADGSRGKAPWLELADDLVGAAWRHASPAGSLLRLPGPVSASGAWSDGLEGYARTFLAAASRIAGENGDDPRGFLDRYADGLRAGTDPDHAERWPHFTERRQAVVEGASIAIGLAETRPWLWDRLDERTKQNTVDWFSGIIGMRGFRNNWLWFQNVMEAFLVSVGADDDADDLAHNHELAEGLYAGDGWYSDGRGRDGERQSFDWYAGWAWHVYPLLESRIRGNELSGVHRERLAAYIDQARSLIGSDGSPAMIGRSVTYRFATLAPFWAGAIAGVSPLETGETRVLGERMIDGFLRGGALNDEGLLSIGWHGEFPRIRQRYTGSASPYWASKGFVGLLLPSDHPEWTTTPSLTEEPRQRGLVAPGWIVSETPADGIVRVINHGSDRVGEPRTIAHVDDPFYRRIGYSNVSSPQLGAEAVSDPRDSHTTLLNADGHAAHRDGIQRIMLTDRVAVSRSRVHFYSPEAIDSQDVSGLALGPILTVASVVHGSAELRLAWWRKAPEASGLAAPTIELDADAAWPRDAGPWRVSFGGWPLANPLTSEPGEVISARAVSRILPLRGADRTELIERTDADPFGRVSVTPLAISSEPLPEATVAVALVELTGAADHGSAARRTATGTPRVEIGDREIRVTWSDGAVD